ncbi:hypothetical protein C8Q77DRAFT_913998 [Trametes polyzona]|nr:hypothetical protein C8Q77DRAFT_913998 [Trametes polyzona]
MIMQLQPPTCPMPTAWSGERELLMARVGVGWASGAWREHRAEGSARKRLGFERSPWTGAGRGRAGLEGSALGLGRADPQRTRGSTRAVTNDTQNVNARGKLSATSRLHSSSNRPQPPSGAMAYLHHALPRPDGRPPAWERARRPPSMLRPIRVGCVNANAKRASNLLGRIGLGYLVANPEQASDTGRLPAGHFPAP